VRFDALPAVRPGSTWGAEWWIAWNHLRSKKTETFLSIVTVLSVIGVTAGVAILNIVISVMTGFEVDLREKVLGTQAHVVVFSHTGSVADPDDQVKRVAEVPGVTGAAPFVYSEMMLRAPLGATGVIAKGVDPVRTGEVLHVVDDLVEGYAPDKSRTLRFADGDHEVRQAFMSSFGEPFPAIGADGTAIPPTPEEPALPGILLGTELRDHLHVAVGDRVQLINPLGGAPGPMGIPTPSMRGVRVAGTFDSGMYEYDNKWTYVTNALAQSFLDMGDKVTGIEVKLDDRDTAEKTAHEIEAALGYPYFARHWKDLNGALFQALELEKLVTGLVLQMTVINAGLLIVNTLIMTVITKGREIAILKAMGATRMSIIRVFIIEGTLIGLVGTCLGTIVGLAGCLVLDGYRYQLQTDVYILDTLPVVIDPSTVCTIALGAMIVCFASTLYPAWRAASLDTVEALRYE
jgi:lipoprotein-releasing system permease protein